MRYGDLLPVGFKMPFGLGGDLKRNPFEAMEIRKGDIAMDCGACVGSWSIAFLKEGGSHVVAYEPEPKNFQKLSLNLLEFGKRACPIMAALIGRTCSTVSLAVGSFSVANTIAPRGDQADKKKIVVKALNFREELLRIRPTVVKIDVEGAEYEMFSTLRSGDLSGVRSLFIEFHKNSINRVSPNNPGVRAIQDFVRGEGLVVSSARLRAWVAERTPVVVKGIGIWRGI